MPNSRETVFSASMRILGFGPQPRNALSEELALVYIGILVEHGKDAWIEMKPVIIIVIMDDDVG